VHRRYRDWVLRHTIVSYLLVGVLSLGILYYAYAFHIRQTLDQIDAIRNNITMIDRQELEAELEGYRRLQKSKQAAYRKALEQSKMDNRGLYTDKYSVAVDILEQVNRSFFNLYRYKLNSSYELLTLQFNGSYLNLIKFFDYLQTIKANITINSYKIELIDGKMLIAITLKIGLIKI